MKTAAILWDIDGTLLNFHKAERRAFDECMKDIGVDSCSDEFVDRYKKLNLSYWKKLELGEIDMQRLLTERFEVFCESEGIYLPDSAAFNKAYQEGLGKYVYINDDSVELVKRLKAIFKQYAVTNGTPAAQHAKLRNSGLDKLFDGIFISREIGYEKPRKEFFDVVFDAIGVDRDEAVVVGDSLTSDIKGANNAGVRAIWYNPDGGERKPGLDIYREIKDLREIESIL